MKKNVWIINHYAGDTYFDKGGRHYWIAKYLKKNGYKPVVFCCNNKHNPGTEEWFRTNKLWEEHVAEDIGTPYVFIRGRKYVGNGGQRVLNMLDFFRNVKKTAIQYVVTHERPDIIIASSVHPLTLVAGIQLARKFGVKCICEIRDLWPESIVAMGIASRNNPLVKLLYRLEKWTCKNCDALITTFEGGYDYFVEHGYENILQKEKYFSLNNGTDLKEFDRNAAKYILADEDLDNDKTFKVMYTGSLRLADGLSQLLGCAKEVLKYKDIQFFVYGSGNLERELERIIERDNLTNVHFKGSVEKKYIPYILSKSSVNMLNYNTAAAATGLYKYGSSQNKLFEYLASGKPIISDAEIGYDIIKRYECGIARNMRDDKDYAEELIKLYKSNENDYANMCCNARRAAENYDFRNSTKKLIEIIETVGNKT